ncbi:N-acetylglucosamine-6-phosphate deacetylase [Paracoccus sp. Z118]|uniref:N-acetylglucosamine-6-phosphate deacetylase n=1 Tax=Paracoccus sp. Z118 TaxID=2851017 RepID=UPI001C2BB353|nr:N-acetylglucosamine-6-phosphate deacetylase [Paracoccus sp. Z118]MBV0891219.1 N-acetylglucosamine-6-phosphate deacetylase [Paracoccus sp. Z118]
MMERPSEPRLIRGRLVFDGSGGEPLADHVVEIDGGRVVALRPARQGDPAPLAGIVAPGFIDMQINGAADTQFNDDPTPEALSRIAAGARAGGTALLLPTFITAPGQDYLRGVEAARQAMARRIPGILGVHLEGPFLSPRRPGIHDPAAIRPLTAADVQALDGFPGVLLVTLAPEAQDRSLIAALADAGAVIFAGHSEAQPGDLPPQISGVTHLWNAMSQLTGRAPGLVGAALQSDRLFAGIIADGHHVAWGNVAMAARLMPERLCLVTDAMLTLAGTRREFDLHGVTIRLDGGRLTDAQGTLAGAHVAMDDSVRNMIRHAGVSPAAALRMASGNPARALGIGGRAGRIAQGCPATLTLLDEGYHAEGVVVDGALYTAG